MARVGASMGAMGSSPERGRRGKGKRRQEVRHGEGEGCRRGHHGCSACCSGLQRSTCAVHENRKQEGEEEKEEREKKKKSKEKKRGKKRKKSEFFFKFENFQEEK
jgi:hypothetical protein